MLKKKQKVMLNSDYYLGNITLFDVIFPIFYAI